jgi:hypothetical protein
MGPYQNDTAVDIVTSVTRRDLNLFGALARSISAFRWQLITAAEVTMNRMMCFLMSLCMSFSGLAYASEPPAPTVNLPVHIEKILPGLESYNSVAQFIEVQSAFNPRFRAQNWGEFAKAHDLHFDKVRFNVLAGQGNEVRVSGVKLPFTFQSDRKTITYRGVNFTFNPGKSAEVNMAQMQKALGKFSELHLRSEQTAFMFPFNLILPQAQAFDFSTAVEYTMAGVLVVLFGSMAVAGLIASEPILIGLAAVGAVTLLLAGLDGAEEANKVTLECKGTPRYVRGDSGSQVAPTDADTKDAIAKICAAGPEKVAAYNQGLAKVADKIQKGDLKVQLPASKAELAADTNAAVAQVKAEQGVTR